MEIVIDTREQRPWTFPTHVKTRKSAMKTGDYTVTGYEDEIAVERKSANDLSSCLCDTSITRYCGQLKRLRSFKYRVVIVETTMFDLHVGNYNAPITPDRMLARLMDTTLRFKVLLLFGTDKKNSAILAEQFMRSAVKQLRVEV